MDSLLCPRCPYGLPPKNCGQGLSRVMRERLILTIVKRQDFLHKILQTYIPVGLFGDFGRRPNLHLPK